MKNLIRAIGLEGLYQLCLRQSLQQGVMLPRDEFLRSAMPVMVDPITLLLLFEHSMAIPVSLKPPNQVHTRRAPLQ